MRIRILTLLCAVALLLVALPRTALAATEEDKAALRESTRQNYLKSRAAAGVDSFAGHCGKMTSYQIWKQGINSYLYSTDGNKQFDTYKDKAKSTGGYYISAYSAEEYTLSEALNAISKNGTKDVYNILVGFQWTETEAGAMYGHAVFVNGILDGMVYFVESFYTSLAGAEGNVIVCSIDQFEDFFDDWTEFEGVIYFGGAGYADCCEENATDIFVRTRFAMPLRSQPCLVGQEDCQMLRSISAGERLRVTGVMKNKQGELYYRVQEDGRVGYIVAETAVLERSNAESLYLEDLTIPENLEVGESGDLTGFVRAKYGLVGAVEIVIADENAEVVARQRQITDSYRVDIAQFNKELDFSDLPEGYYTVSVYADTASAYVKDGSLDYTYATMLLDQRSLWIGTPNTIPAVATAEKNGVLDGWYFQDNTWYCYDNGVPRTGWIREKGVEYYLQEDGSVTTGWAEVDGEKRFFSSTGAMVVGWLNTSEGLRYSFSDGRFADGWQVIGVSRYYFDNGIAKTEGTRTDGGVEYHFRSDGKAIAEN